VVIGHNTILAYFATRHLAQLAERKARYPKVLGSNPSFSTPHITTVITCVLPAVGGMK
jgi:predicted AlkP superfamily pyrophosphatase or phosphodiesterase